VVSVGLGLIIGWHAPRVPGRIGRFFPPCRRRSIKYAFCLLNRPVDSRPGSLPSHCGADCRYYASRNVANRLNAQANPPPKSKAKKCELTENVSECLVSACNFGIISNGTPDAFTRASYKQDRSASTSLTPVQLEIEKHGCD